MRKIISILLMVLATGVLLFGVAFSEMDVNEYIAIKAIETQAALLRADLKTFNNAINARKAAFAEIFQANPNCINSTLKGKVTYWGETLETVKNDTLQPLYLQIKTDIPNIN